MERYRHVLHEPNKRGKAKLATPKKHAIPLRKNQPTILDYFNGKKEKKRKSEEDNLNVAIKRQCTSPTTLNLTPAVFECFPAAELSYSDTSSVGDDAKLGYSDTSSVVDDANIKLVNDVRTDLFPEIKKVNLFKKVPQNKTLNDVILIEDDDDGDISGVSDVLSAIEINTPPFVPLKSGSSKNILQKNDVIVINTPPFVPLKRGSRKNILQKNDVILINSSIESMASDDSIESDCLGKFEADHLVDVNGNIDTDNSCGHTENLSGELSTDMESVGVMTEDSICQTTAESLFCNDNFSRKPVGSDSLMCSTPTLVCCSTPTLVCSQANCTIEKRLSPVKVQTSTGSVSMHGRIRKAKRYSDFIVQPVKKPLKVSKSESALKMETNNPQLKNVNKGVMPNRQNHGNMLRDVLVKIPDTMYQRKTRKSTISEDESNDKPTEEVTTTKSSEMSKETKSSEVSQEIDVLCGKILTIKNAQNDTFQFPAHNLVRM